MPARFLQATLLIIPFVFISCASQPSATMHLTVLDASVRTWKPGVVKSNTQRSGGEIYEVKLKVQKSGKYNFQSLTVERQMLDVELHNADSTEKFSKGDTITLVSRTDVTKQAADASEENVSLINSDSIQAIINYNFDSNPFLLPVKTISKTSTILNQ